PSWAGEMLPRSYDLSLGVGKFRDMVASFIKEGKDRHEIEDRLIREYLLDRGSARSIVNYLSEQISIIPEVPSDRRLLIEGFIDERGRRNLIFHFPFGRRVNDALSRAYARVISRKLATNVKVSLNDDSFMLTFSHRMPVEGTAGLVSSGNLEELLRSSVRYTELFKQRFRHCANRGFMILKNYLGREIPMGRQQFRSVRILEAIHGLEEHPILMETYNEILHDVMDIDNALKVLRGIESGKIGVEYEDYHEIPSPLAHNIVLMGISDIVLMEDRSALLRELHKKVLATAFSEEEFRYRLSLVEEYFKEKRPFVDAKENLLEAISRLQPLNLFVERGRNIYEYSDVEREILQRWCRSLVNEGVVESVYRNGELWALSREAGEFEALYEERVPLEDEEQELLEEMPFEVGEENTPTLLKLAARLNRRKDTLRKFQRAYLVKGLFVRHGEDWEEVYIRRKEKKAEYESALDRAIIRHLDLFAPAGLEELSYYLSLSEGVLRQAVDELVEKGLVCTGAFVIGKLTPQYMLARDVRALDEMVASSYRVFDESTVTAYLHEKQMVDAIDDYLELFGSASSARVVYQHTRSFSRERWIALLKQELVQGRFVRHRVGFVRKVDVPLYASAYRNTEALEPLDGQVLKFVEGNPGCTRREIMNGLNAPQEMVVDSIERLDYTLNLVRVPELRMGGEFSSVNRYELIDRYLHREIGYEEAREHIILQHLGAFGPTTISDLRRSTMFRMEDIERVLSRHRDLVEKITVLGDVEMVMYLFKDDLERLEGFHPNPTGVEIYSRMDPSIRHLMPEIRSRFGEGWYSPIVYNGRPVGVIIHWSMSDAIDVREVLLQEGFEDDHPSELARALNDFMRFYRETGNDILRIRRLGRKEIKGLGKEILHAFTMEGFKRIHSWLVSGEIVRRSFNPDELLSYVFYRQHLHRDSLFDNSYEAIDAMGGFRNNFELQLRLRNPEPIQAAIRRHKLVSGIALPPYVLYMTMEQAGIYQKAKSVPLTREMEEVLRALRSRMHYKEIFIRTSLPPSRFRETLKKLRDGLYILRLPWSFYMRVPQVEISPEEARKWVLGKAMDSLGIVTAERLYGYFKGAFRMREIREFLREMEKNDYLAKGFLNRRNESLYYIIKEDIRKVLQHPFRQEFVLSPQDRLFHYLAQDVRARFGMGACYVVFRGTRMTGAFKTRKQGRFITIREFVGGKEEKRIVRYWGSVNNFVLLWD
ncbi:MAG: hypothetical protein KAU14_05970, partial [Thermoplasmata archaeon]|nr:hypothetical protein [Thermoplasmata archaeon]